MTPLYATSVTVDRSECGLSIGWAIATTSVMLTPCVVMLESSSALYARAAAQLLPPGRAFDPRPGSLLAALCDGLSREFSRVARAIDDLVARLAPAASSPDWVRIFGRDPADVAAIDGPVRWADILAILPTTYGGVRLSYVAQERDPTRAGIARAGDILRGDASMFSLWITITPSINSLSSNQIDELIQLVRGAAAGLIPPTCTLKVDFREA